jgi:hypothetical protein
MKNFYFMQVALSWLAEPRHFNRLFAITLRAVGVLVVPASLVAFFKAGKVIFNLPASGILGGILFQLFFIAAIYGVVHGLFIRARDVDALPGGEYNMFPLAAIVTRAVGEAFAVFVALVTIGGGIFVWFTGRGVNTILTPLPGFLPVFGDTTFMGGIQFMVGGVLSAILVLGLAYLVAEVLRWAGDAAVRHGEAKRPAEVPYKLRSGTGN